MWLLALLIDALAIGLNLLAPSPLLSVIVQAVFVLALLVLTIAYRAPRRERQDRLYKGYRYFTIRYSLVLISLILNLVVFGVYLAGLL